MSRSVSAPSSVTNTSPCWNGDIVPGSTLMYGSSLMLVTRMPRDSRIAARDAAAMPLPREETTPPVTKTYLVIYFGRVGMEKFTGVRRYAQMTAEVFHDARPFSARRTVCRFVRLVPARSDSPRGAISAGREQRRDRAGDRAAAREAPRQ